MQCQAILLLYFCFITTWLFLMLRCRTKRKYSQILLLFGFSATTMAMSLLTSSFCLQGNYYHNNVILQREKIVTGELLRNIKLLDDSYSNATTKKISARNLVSHAHTNSANTNITKNNNIETTAQVIFTQELTTVDIAREEPPTSSQRNKELLVFEWNEDAYNGENVAMKLREYLAMSNLITRINQIQMITINNDLDSSWKMIPFQRPLTHTDAINKYSMFLPWWEIKEIQHYSKIWYLGLGVKKNIFNTNTTNNFGFGAYIKDKEYSNNRFYNAIVGDHVAYRYKILKKLGRGTFGNVVEVLDYKEQKHVAIKFFRTNYNKGISKRDVRELNMMSKISREAKHTSYYPIIYDHFIFRNHLCVVEELLGDDLHHHINDEIIHDIATLKRYAKAILKPLADLHEKNICHMDLKPLNIAFDKENSAVSDLQFLKLVDFGHSCIVGSEEFACLEPDYVQTPGYECPEVILNLPYGTACDMFDVGIILLRLATGRQQFDGENSKDSFALMLEIIGIPPPRMLELSDQKKRFMDAVCYVKENGFKRVPYRKPLKQIASELPEDFVDFISLFLKYEPSERPTANEALNHPYLNQHNHHIPSL